MKKLKFPIRYYGHKDLRTKAEQVETFDADLEKLAQDMVDTMMALDNCIGFAGPQLGILKRIFVIREEKFLPNNQYTFGPPEVIINPVLTHPSEEVEEMLEGCMSFPSFYVPVKRPIAIHVRYQNVKGEFIEEDLKDFRARMFMHENDHLNGVLHIDRMDPHDRKKIEDQLRQLKKKWQNL